MYIKVNENNEVIEMYGDEFAPDNVKESQDFIHLDKVEEPQAPGGKYAITKYDREKALIYYEYLDIPLTPQEQKIAEMQGQITTQNNIIAELTIALSMLMMPTGGQ